MIRYSTDKPVDIEQVIHLYKTSFIELKRPVEDKDKMQALIEHANVVISAWDNSTLVGLCRGFSDFNFVTYISDLAVLNNYQNQGIGKELLAKVREFTDHSTRLVLLSNVSANAYYDKLGFSRHDRAWVLDS